MSGLLRRMRRGRDAPDPAPDAGAARDGIDAPPPEDPAGAVLAVPAGTDLDELVGAPPGSRRRSKVRRRLRHLRRVREVLLRDLGGFVFELHRAEGEQSEGETALVVAKLERVGRVDAELRELEVELDDRRPMTLREPGIGGSCAVCGELFGSEARFCWACGTPVAPGAVRPVSAVAAAATGAQALAAPALAAGDGPAQATPPPLPPMPHIEGTSEEMPLADPPPPPAASGAQGAPVPPPQGAPVPPPQGAPGPQPHGAPGPPPPPAADDDAPTSVQDRTAEQRP